MNKMKKSILFVVLAGILCGGCNKNDNHLFEMKYIADFTIQAGLNPFAGIHVFEINNIDGNSLAYLSQNGSTAEDISAVNPGVSFMAPIFTDGNYGYIQEISIKMYSMSDPSFEKEIFYHDQIQINQSGDLQLIGTLVDVQDFLWDDEFGIRVELRLRDFSPETNETRLDFSFFAK